MLFAANKNSARQQKRKCKFINRQFAKFGWPNSFNLRPTMQCNLFYLSLLVFHDVYMCMQTTKLHCIAKGSGNT